MDQNNLGYMDSEIVEIEVYHFDFGGSYGTWVWNFGLFSLVGTESNPKHSFSKMDTYSAITNGFSRSAFLEEEPEFVDEREVFFGDYVLYVESDFDTSGYFLNEDNDPYKLNLSKVQYEETELFILTECELASKECIAITESDLQDNWTPVILIE